MLLYETLQLIGARVIHAIIGRSSATANFGTDVIIEIDVMILTGDLLPHPHQVKSQKSLQIHFSPNFCLPGVTGAHLEFCLIKRNVPARRACNRIFPL